MSKASEVSKESLKVCVVGSLNEDRFLSVTRMPEEGETLGAQGCELIFGGKGANQAVAAGSLNSSGMTFMIGQLGKDGAGDNYIHELAKKNVNTDYLKQIEGEQTGTAYIVLNTTSADNFIIIVGGANQAHGEESTYEMDKESAAAIADSHVLLLQREIPEKVNIAAAKAAKQNGSKTMTILDMGGNDEPISAELLNLCDIVSPNQTELMRMKPADYSGPSDKASVIRHLLDIYPNMKSIVLKEGSLGSSWWSKQQTEGAPTASDNLNVVFAPAHSDKTGEFKVIDTTGAGDCFTGAFAVKYAECLNIFDSLCFANFAAYICTTKVGAQNAPTRQEVEKLMKENPICPKEAIDQYSEEQSQSESLETSSNISDVIGEVKQQSQTPATDSPSPFLSNYAALAGATVMAGLGLMAWKVLKN